MAGLFDLGIERRNIQRSQNRLTDLLTQLYGPQQAPFQAETFGPEDPLQQLQQAGQSGLTQTLPGLLPQRHIQGIAGMLANPETRQFGTALLGQFIPQDQKPTTLMQNLSAAGLQQGTPEYQQTIMDYLLKPQTQVNIGDTKPIGANASQWRNPQGQAPDPRLTVNQAAAMGYMPQTTDQLKAAQSATEAAPVFGDLINFGFGKPGQKSLFPPATATSSDRAKSAGEAWLAGITESNARISVYNSSRDAVVTGLARLVGNVGTLTDRDVDTVRSLLPVAGFTPEPVAKEKFKQIANLLRSKGVPNEKLRELGFPAWAIGQGTPIPPGFRKVNPNE